MNNPKYRIDLNLDELNNVQLALQARMDMLAKRMNADPDHPMYLLRAESLGRCAALDKRLKKKRR